MYQPDTVCKFCHRTSDITYHESCLDCLEDDLGIAYTDAKSFALDLLALMHDLVSHGRIKNASTVNRLLCLICLTLEDHISLAVNSIAICIWDAAASGRKLPRIPVPLEVA